MTWESLQISINGGPQPKGKGIPGDTNFFQDKLFKQGSSLTLSLSLQVIRKLSLKEFSSLLHLRLKFTKNEALLDQAKTPHKSSSTTLWKQIKVLFKVSNHNILLRNTRPNSRSCKAQILAWLISQINQVTIHQIQGKNQRIVLFFWKNILHRDCTHSYI